MSFILDALRKSDARRQQGGPPGLNSPETSPPPRRRRRARWGVMALAGLVVVAVAAGGITVLRPQWLPQQLVGVPDDPTAPPAQPESSPAEPVSQDGPDESGSLTAADIRQRMTGRRADSDQASTVARAEPVDEEPATEPTTERETERPGEESTAQSVEASAESAPVDRRQPRAASPARSVSRQAPQRETTPMPPEEGLEELERRLAQGQQRGEQSERGGNARSNAADGGPADRARRRDQNASQAPPDDGAPSQPLSQGVAEYVRQWELPLAVRRNLPQLKLNIHVFSPRQEERFVLVNGERFVAGDSLGQGATLVDIRREGAIVDFRSHRFLLEPR